MSNNGTREHPRVGTTNRPVPGGPIIVHDDSINIVDFEEHDPATVAFIATADDPVEATHQCLQVGVLAIKAAHVSLETDLVRGRFDAMSEQFDTQVETAVNQIVEATRLLVNDETGAIPVALEAHHQKLEELLGATFDPESKKSVLALFEQVMADTHQSQVEALRQIISTDGEDGPMARMKNSIVLEVGRGLGEIKSDVRDLSEKIAIKTAVAPVIAITTAKGFAFETVVLSKVSDIAAPLGDTVEDVGTVAGSKGNKKGDLLVTVNRDDTYGRDGRFVFEAKSTRLNMRKTLDELDEALENRDAQAAVAVFSSQDEAPTTVPFSYSDNRAIAVLDEDGDDAALHLACMWARWLVRRHFASAGGGDLDTARITALIEDAGRALDRSTTIKRSHTQARKGIEQAGRELTSLVTEVREALEALATELDTSSDHE